MGKRKEMSNSSKGFIYVLSIIFAVLAVVGIFAFGCLAIMEFISTSSDTGANETKIIIYLILAFLCFLLERWMFSVRTTARDEISHDEFGNKKKNEYKNLSAKDRQKIDLIKVADRERLISNQELKTVIHDGSKHPIEELDKLIGLNNVKEEVLRLQSMMEYEQKYWKKNKEKQIAGSHFCFLGAPGTGKTTVARIMTGILYRYKYIKKNQCVEVDASFLKGATPDDTLKKVRIILQASKQGVLFIDEAYSLLDGVNGSEIVAELVKYMEDNKNDFVLILAGYQNNMRQLIDSNPGLHSRISKYLLFKDYDITELKDIFRTVANSAGYFVEEEAYENFEIRINKEKRLKNFGNARTVKNIFQKAKEKHAFNIMNGVLGKDKLYAICGVDVDQTVDEW